jgi:hypothetical protein
MQVILLRSLKNNINNNIPSSFRFNKTLRFNICNKNFTFYKLSERKFCEKKINEATSIINTTNSNTSTNNSEINILEEIEKMSLEESKQINLGKYVKNDIDNPDPNSGELAKKTTSSSSKLPVQTKTQIIGGEEVEIFVPDKKSSSMENFKNYREFLARKEHYEKEYSNHKMKIGFAIFLFFLGLYSLWIPLYKSICESQGFSVKTNHVDYKFDGKKRKQIL